MASHGVPVLCRQSCHILTAYCILACHIRAQWRDGARLCTSVIGIDKLLTALAVESILFMLLVDLDKTKLVTTY